VGHGGTRAEKVNAYNVLTGGFLLWLVGNGILMWVLHYSVGDIGVMRAVHVSDRLFLREGFVTSSAMFKLKRSKYQVSATSVSI